jgi:Ca2+-binding RTX toxin-like protein
MNATKAFEQAELALGAYAVLLPGRTDDQRARLVADAQMSPKQSEQFANRYPDVIAQVNDAASGLSLTVFRGADGAIALALRGTEPALNDWFPTNVNVAINGAGYQQIAALYNAWQRLTHRLGEEITIYGVDLSNPANPVVARTVANDLGSATAPLISPGAAVDVAGHSLGGHLALAFAGLFPLNARQVHAFNAPGFIDSTLNRNFFARLGGQLPVGPNPGGVQVVNVIADAQPGAGESFSLVARLHSRPGIALNVAIENQVPPTDEPNMSSTLNHSQMILTDSLAVFALLARLAPALSTASFEALLGSAALGTAASLERIVDALARTLGANRSPLPAGNANRNALYEAIYALQSAPAYRALEGSAALRVLAEVNAETLQARSKTDFGYFVAVRELLPFALEGAGSALIDAHPELYARWSADRARRIAGASDLEFTDPYLADRAAFLGWKLLANSADVTTILDAAYVAGSRLRYSDLPSGFTVTVSNAVLAPGDDTAKRFVFGDDGADALSGGSLSDRLYGDRGSDVLAGRRGDDYLEGGAGMDVYEYRASSGILGSGNDGADTVRDTDGRGVLRYSFEGASRAIAGAAIKVSDAEWLSADGKFTYGRQGPDLVVTINGDAGGSLLLKDYRDGDFGIRLMGPLTDPSPQNFDIRGDLAPVDFDLDAAGLQTQTDSLGNVITDANSPAPDREDLLYDSAEADFIAAGGGDDVVLALRGGGDWVQGGAGRDRIQTGAGDDLVEGGSGEDIAQGGAGDDRLYGRDKVELAAAIVAGETAAGFAGRGDLLSGDAGDDLLVGSTFADLLLGGEGRDVIVAGGGDDDLFGDDGLQWALLDWSAMRSVAEADGVRTYTHAIGNAGAARNAIAGEADVLYGGSGADWVFASGGEDFVEGGSGADVLFGEAGADILIGGEGDDVLIGDNPGLVGGAGEGADYLDGGAGDDILQGNGGEDILIGGAGNDVLAGGAGKDVYVFYRGDGADLLIDDSTGAEASVLIFGEGFDPGRLVIGPGSMLLDFGAGDSVDLGSFDHFDPDAAAPFESLVFADGTTLTFADVLAIGFTVTGTEEDDNGRDTGHPVLVGTAFKDKISGLGGNDELQGREGDDFLDGGAGDDRLFGMAGNDTLHGGEGNDALAGDAGDDRLSGGAGRDALWGGAGNDTLDGGEGRDVLIGGAGDDVYVFGAGDTAFDFDGASTVRFGEGIAPRDLSLRRQVVNGVPVYSIGLNGAATDAEKLILRISQDAQLAAFAFADGTVLDHEALLHETWVDQQVLVGGAENDLLDAYAGEDWLRGGEGDDLLIGRRGADRLDGEAGDDILAGGPGDDALSGGEGSDTYLYAKGDGDDRVSEDGDVASTDILRFTDATSAEVTVVRRPNGDLLISVAGAGSVTVTDFYNSPTRRIERIEFADGTILDSAALASLSVPPISGTDGDDVLTGTPHGDVIRGGAGNDTLDGAGGPDILEGGPGADTYRLPAFGGVDRAVEDGAETSTVTLDPGIGFNALAVSCSGDDLVIGLRAGSSGLALADFYAGQTNWIIRSAAGETKTAQELIDFLATAPSPGTPAEYRQAYLDSARAQYAAYLASFGASGGVQVNVQAPSDAATIYKSPPYYESGSGGIYYLNIADITGGPSANILDLRASGPAMVEALGGNDLIDNQGRGFANTAPFVSIGSFLNGGAGDDRILGSWSADTLYGGGGGNDVLAGSDGNDTYLVFAGDTGNVTINEVTDVDFGGGHSGFPGARDSTDTLILSGMAFRDVTFSVGTFLSTATFPPASRATLNISWGTGSASVVFPDPNNPLLAQYPGASYGVETIRFADGTVLTLDQILPDLVTATLGTPGDEYTVVGTAEDDVLNAPPPFFSPAGLTEYRTTLDGREGNDALAGGGQNDVLIGGPGYDILSGRGGDDILVGGAGDDQLYGGQGSDLFLFEIGWGQDFLKDTVSTGPLGLITGTIRFGADISPSDIGVMDDGFVLYVVHKHTGDRIDLFGASPTGWAGYGVNRVEFADGTVWSRADLLARIGPIPGTEGDDFICSAAGDDAIAGRGGDDVIYGAEGNDILRGGAGADNIQDWGPGRNLVDAGPGDDYVYEEGHSFVAGGPGDDVIEHYGPEGVIAFNRGDGADTVRVAGSLTLSLGGGITAGDIALAADGADYVLSLGGGDSIRLTGLDPQLSSVTVQIVADDIRTYDLFDLATALSVSTNALRGGDLAYAYARGELDTALDEAAIRAVIGAPEFGSGPQIARRAPAAPVSGGDNGGVLFGSDLNEVISGGAGSDWLDGGAGDDTLAGGGGDDLLTGGPGADTYVYNLGDGTDTIADPSGPGQQNTLRFGPGIDPGSLTLGLGSLLIRVGDSAGALHLESFDPQNPFGPRDIDRFVFADGSELGYEQLLERGFDLYGTERADIIAGTALADRVTGGKGNDLLFAGFGGDTYLYASGDGADRIIEADDPGATDVLRFGLGVDAARVRVHRRGDDIVIGLPGAGDSVTLADWFAAPSRRIERVEFADGSFWDGTALESRLVPELLNRPPRLASPIADQAATEDQPFSFTLPAGTFSDADAGDSLVLSATRSDGAPLPGWLSFDSASGRFSGTPTNDDVGSLGITVVATDTAGVSASGAFRLDVANVNDAPVVANPIQGQSVEAGTSFVFTVPPDTFLDVDAGDSLGFSAGLAGGAPLPAWLSFDPASARFSGAPRTSDIGILHVAVTATDRSGARAVSDFGLIVRAPAGSRVSGTAGDDLLYGGTGNEALMAKGGNDYLFGDTGDDVLKAASGNDILQGGSGDDAMHAGSGRNLLDGGSGDDLIYGGRGAGLIIGGSGNDIIRTARGHDVIVFNRGDGHDLVYADREGNNTLSLGGGIRYEDLRFRKSGNDLVLELGGSDSITFKHWYAGHGRTSLLNIQIVTEAMAGFDDAAADPTAGARVNVFDARGLVQAFDAARAANPYLDSWALSDALNRFHLWGADDAALGGDLAYQYGLRGSLAGISLAAAQDVIGASGFGSEAQSLRPFAGLAEGFAKLS